MHDCEDSIALAEPADDSTNIVSDPDGQPVLPIILLIAQ
jgi:hypothetical protein